MQIKLLKEVLYDYDKINLIINATGLLDKFSFNSNHELIEFWRNEVLAEKKSIYVIGKTSTGKSTFLNFLLAFDTKNIPLFKTSTKVETGIIQSLENCESISQAHARLEFNAIEKINSNVFPDYCKYLKQTNELFFPLDTEERINYFRDHIIAKKNVADEINLINTVQNISIKFPLKFFKNYKIIDTPGLGSSISETDPIVLNNFNGKSFIVWLINGSNRNLSDDLVLLDNNKGLFNDSIKNINFIINQFDQADYDVEKTSIEVSNRKNEITKKINKYVSNNLIYLKNSCVYFTSFKNPRTKFSGKNTYQQIEKLEVELLTQHKNQNIQNIKLLLELLKEQLKNYSKVINKELEIINKDLEDNYRVKKKIEYNLSDSKKIIKETLVYKDNLQNNFKEVQNGFGKIKNRKIFDNTLNDVNKYINMYSKKIYDSINRINLEKIKTFSYKLNSAKKEIKFSFESNENFFRKHFWDQELKDKKKILASSMESKIKEFDLIFPALEKDISNHFDELIKKNNLLLEKHHVKKDYTQSILNKVNSTIHNIAIYPTNLLKNEEESIESWKINNSICKFENFLQLYKLTENHSRIKKTFKHEQ